MYRDVFKFWSLDRTWCEVCTFDVKCTKHYPSFEIPPKLAVVSVHLTQNVQSIIQVLESSQNVAVEFVQCS